MIEVIDLKHCFGSLEVLRGVHFSVRKGEMVSILGRSGAGKSTLLQIIGTLLRPTSGKVLIGGTDVFGLDDKQMSQFRNQHIGFIFQQSQLLPEFTALENVMIPGMIARQDERDLRQRATQLLTQLGLSERLHHKPSALSGGEQQRVAAARALIMQPDIILADEPSGSLDEHNKKELHQLLLSLRDQYKQTIIIVTHDKDLAAITDRQLVIRDGVMCD